MGIRIDKSLPIFYYIGRAEGHEYPNLQVGDEVNPRRFFALANIVQPLLLFKKDCELVHSNICMEQGYKIHAMEIVDDHVHLFLEFRPSYSLSRVVQF